MNQVKLSFKNEFLGEAIGNKGNVKIGQQEDRKSVV